MNSEIAEIMDILVTKFGPSVHIEIYPDGACELFDIALDGPVLRFDSFDDMVRDVHGWMKGL